MQLVSWHFEESGLSGGLLEPHKALSFAVFTEYAEAGQTADSASLPRCTEPGGSAEAADSFQDIFQGQSHIQLGV